MVHFDPALLFTSLRTSPKLWSQRPNGSLMVAILQGLSCHMASSLHDNFQVCVVPGRHHSRTSWLWAIKVGPALLVLLDGSAHHTLVAAKLTSYLSLGHAGIVQGKDRCSLFPRQVLRCVHGQQCEIAFIITVNICRLPEDNPRAMLEVWGLITIPTKSNLALKFA